jgi:hypothetical protein
MILVVGAVGMKTDDRRGRSHQVLLMMILVMKISHVVLLLIRGKRRVREGSHVKTWIVVDVAVVVVVHIVVHIVVHLARRG